MYNTEIDKFRNKIINGHVLDALRIVPDKSVKMIITSPPYYKLRKYGAACLWRDGWYGELGDEPTFKLFIEHLILIFKECFRVLRDDGTIWVNLGDSYYNDNKSNYKGVTNEGIASKTADHLKSIGRVKVQKQGLKPKSLMNIPGRFAIAMTDELQYILRNRIVWYKPNCMPSDAKDRFTVNFEDLFFFSKKEKYYFEQQFEDHLEESIKRALRGSSAKNKYNKEDHLPDGVHIPTMSKGREHQGYENMHEKVANGETLLNPLGSNKRCVWKIATQPYKEDHFAAFPEELVTIPIQAGSPEFVCSVCGKPRIKLFKPTGNMKKWNNSNKCKTADHIKASPSSSLKTKEVKEKAFAGWQECECKVPDGVEKWKPGIVMDIFGGRGTTGDVSNKLKRDFIVVEMVPKFAEMAQKNTNHLFNSVEIVTV